MAEPAAASPATEPFQAPARRFWVIAAFVVVALFAAYWLLLREPYVPVLENIDPENAADVIKVLEAKDIPYTLADAGRSVLVPSGAADKARVELVGSELPMRGQVGFELFNQSDMGFTEFAQKINYQRALQGELARTILLLDGIQSVRVHLGLPERTLFRDEQMRPKASVAVLLKPGAALTQSRVSGLQRIVAGAVPELTPDAVAVLDGSGRIVSAEAPFPDAPGTTSDALIASYRQRIAAAIRSVDPALAAEPVVSLRYLSGSAAPTPPGQADDSAAPQVAATAAARAYLLNVRVQTREALAEEAQGALARAIEGAIGLDPSKGDILAFVTGFVPAPVQAQAAPGGDAVVAIRRAAAPEIARYAWLAYWPAVLAAAGLLLAGAFVRDRRRARLRRDAGLQTFADTLRERLAAQPAQAA
jgi:flagellar M-ring protein FliF